MSRKTIAKSATHQRWTSTINNEKGKVMYTQVYTRAFFYYFVEMADLRTSHNGCA